MTAERGGPAQPRAGGQPRTQPDLAALGLTDRQFRHWIARGYLRPQNPNPCSGKRLVWSPEELEIAARMAHLVDIGCTVCLAHEVPRGRPDFPHPTRIPIDLPPEKV